jgi:hypothetical protein
MTRPPRCTNTIRPDDGDAPELCVQFDSVPFWWLTGYAILDPYDPEETERQVGVSFHWGSDTPTDEWGATGIGAAFYEPEKLERVGNWMLAMADALRKAHADTL